MPRDLLVRARRIEPVISPTIHDAALLVRDENILDLGPAHALSRSHPSAEHLDLGDVLLLPGLVNAHTHLELSDSDSPLETPGSFVDWLAHVIRARASLGDHAPAAAAHAATRGARECLARGVTTAGDVSKFAPHTRPVLAESPLRVVSFGEVQAMAGRRHLLDPRLADATDFRFDGWHHRNRLLVAVSPHAPYSVEPDGYLACLRWSQTRGRPLATHLAEHPDEATFLRDHSGQFRRLWDLLRDWKNDVPTFDHGPIFFAKSLGLLNPKTLLAHVNYADDDELDILAKSGASVVWCPRTHRFFGHAPHRWEDMINRGINVCVGTDSRASSPDLDPLEDLRLLRNKLPAADLLRMVTLNPARALGVKIGALAPGFPADCVAFPVRTPGDLLDAQVSPSAVLIGGYFV